MFPENRTRGWIHASKAEDGAAWYTDAYSLAIIFNVLEKDENVISYQSNVEFKLLSKPRYIDFIATYKDGTEKMIIGKSAADITKMNIQTYRDIEAYKKFANQNNIELQIFDEQKLGFKNEEEIIYWSEYLQKTLSCVDTSLIKKIKRKKSYTKYNNKIREKRKLIFCGYCLDFHEIAEKGYNINIKKNGRYICKNESDHINGLKTAERPKKENPYAKDGKKQCSTCSRILEFENFHKDKSKLDGCYTICKDCRKNTTKGN